MEVPHCRDISVDVLTVRLRHERMPIYTHARANAPIDERIFFFFHTLKSTGECTFAEVRGCLRQTNKSR